MNKQQSKEEQLEIIQGELQKAIDTFQLSAAVLCQTGIQYRRFRLLVV